MTSATSALRLSDLAEGNAFSDPYPLYAQLRASDPVHWDDRSRTWALLKFDDIAFACQDARFSKAIGLRNRFNSLAEADRDVVRPAFEFLARSVVYSDPPEHTRMRSAFNRPFMPRSIAALRDGVQRIVDGMFDAVAGQSQIELMREWAFVLPAAVICHMIGLPLEDQPRFKQWSDDVVGMLATVSNTHERMERAGRSTVAISAYIRDIIEQRRSEPREDLLSAMVAMEREGVKLDYDELVSNCVALLIGGHETTTNLIGNGVLSLLRNPAQYELLKENPELVTSAVEEIIRYEPSVQMAYRSLTEDMTIRGRQLARGDIVNLVFGSANRDEDHFPDAERFDITRTTRHLGFGTGIHSCLGGTLARLEVQVFVATLIRRYPGLRLAQAEPQWNSMLNLRGLKSLPVRLH